MVAKKPTVRIETDKVKNAVADAIMSLIAQGEREIPDALMDQTSGKALRNRMYFVLQTDSETNVYISAGTVSSYDKSGELEDNIDGFINVLLPVGCGGVAEQTFSFDKDTSAEKAAKILYDYGFQFSEKLQNEFEQGLTARVKKAIGLVPANDFNKKSEKKKPAPKKTTDAKKENKKKDDKKDDNNKGPKGPGGGGFGPGGFGGGGGGCMGWGGFSGRGF